MSLKGSDCHKKHSSEDDHICAQSSKRSKGSSGKATQLGQTGAKRGRGRGRGKARGSISSQASSVKGTRSLLDPRRQQHEKISQMYVYTQKLEKALAELQKRVSSDPHPLLTVAVEDSPSFDTTSALSVSLDSDAMSETGNRLSDEEDLLAEAFGVMSIYNDGTEFHGPTATSEYLLKVYRQKTQSTQAVDSDELEIDLNIFTNYVPSRLDACPELLFLSVQFPCPPVGQKPPEMNRFIPFLPTYERARKLLHNYFSHFSWLAMPIPNEDLERIFNAFYPRCTRIQALKLAEVHSLAVLFMAFVLGTLYDLDMDYTTLSVEAEEYHLLARAALASDPVTENTTMNGVQAFILMIWYFRLVPGRRSPSYQWGLSGYLMRLVQAIGLHRNSRDRSLYTQNETGYRRFEQTFWEYHVMDIWQSFMFGRPTSITANMVQCKIPVDAEVLDVHPGFHSGYYIWKYSFTSLVCNVIAITSADTVTYNDILACEKDLRKHHTPLGLEWPRNDNTYEVPGKSFQRCLTAIWKQVSIMYIHRPYFWDAITRHPDEPFKSRYWHSVRSAHKSACTLVADMRRLWLVHPMLIGRMAPFWSHAQSAAYVLGALVSHSPGCKFSMEALQRFEETLDMFSGAKDSLLPTNAVSDMQKLLFKARQAMNSPRIQDKASQSSGPSPPAPSPGGSSGQGASPDTKPSTPNSLIPEAYTPPSNGTLSEVFAYLSTQHGSDWDWIASSRSGLQ